MKKPVTVKQTIIGVDVGFQYTKVAIAFANIGDAPSEIVIAGLQEGGPSKALPTMVRRDGQEIRWFKLRALSPARHLQSGGLSGDMTQDLAKYYLIQFLRDLLPQIRGFYEKARAQIGSFPQWHDAEIEFAFSVPSAVPQEGAVALKMAAEEAGFACDSARHKILDIKLSEAEAAAVGAIRDSVDELKPGDRVLVLDVGGGTSDVAMMIVTEGGKCQLDRIVLCPITSEQLGGAYIDNAIRVVFERLLKDAGLSLTSARSKSQALIFSRDYHACKVESQEMVVENPELHLSTTRLSETSGISLIGPDLHLKPSVFQEYLDVQLRGSGSEDNLQGGIIEQVIMMRDDLSQRTPSDSKEYKRMYGKAAEVSRTIDAVVFVGGVCKSTHLQKVIQKHLQTAPDSELRSEILATVRNTKFISPQRPQFCVCEGLVHSRMQEISAGPKSWKETRFGKIRF